MKQLPIEIISTLNYQQSTINHGATLDFRLLARAGPNASAPFPLGKEIGFMLKIAYPAFFTASFFHWFHFLPRLP